LNEHHNNPKFKNHCILCHEAKRPTPAVPAKWFLKNIEVQQDGDFLIIRLPKKAGPAGDQEFLRRICLDLLGRTPTTLEMHYFLKDTDPHKHRKVVEKLIGDGDYSLEVQRLLLEMKTVDKASRAEEYVKEKLGKKQLTPEERQLMRKVLEFAEKDQLKTGPDSADYLRFWFEGTPKAIQPPKK
jgi:hypothetical protein